MAVPVIPLKGKAIAGLMAAKLGGGALRGAGTLAGKLGVGVIGAGKGIVGGVVGGVARNRIVQKAVLAGAILTVAKGAMPLEGQEVEMFGPHLPDAEMRAEAHGSTFDRMAEEAQGTPQDAPDVTQVQTAETGMELGAS